MTIEVLVDTTVLVNFMTAGGLATLRAIPDTRFHVTDSVVSEVLHESQKTLLRVEIGDGAIAEARAEEIDDLADFARMRPRLGGGEASCLLLGRRNGWFVATDDSADSMPTWVDATVTRARMMTTGTLRMSIASGALVTDPSVAGASAWSPKPRRRRRSKRAAKPSPAVGQGKSGPSSSATDRTSEGLPPPATFS